MKKLLVPLLLFVATISGAAEKWSIIANSANFDSYINYSTIRSNGAYKEAWFITDYRGVIREASGNRFMSLKAKIRFDCKQEKTLSLSILAYSEPMGAGTIVLTDDTGMWVHVVPGSDGAIKYDLVCRNRR